MVDLFNLELAFKEFFMSVLAIHVFPTVKAVTLVCFYNVGAAQVDVVPVLVKQGGAGCHDGCHLDDTI